MISGRFVRLADGTIVRHREPKTELAGWEQVSERCRVRRVRERGEG
jgi:hypothetical protein